MAARYYTLSGIEAARDWAPTPGVVERARFLHDDEGDRYLDLVYRYEFQGKTYRSDRLDLMPGRMGDDILWEEQLLARSPVGARITCYADAANPGMALAFLFNTPWQVQLAWAFFAGFASVFTMLEGPAGPSNTLH